MKKGRVFIQHNARLWNISVFLQCTVGPRPSWYAAVLHVSHVVRYG